MAQNTATAEELLASAPARSVAAVNFGRWGTVLGALMIQMILGTVYGFSVFVEPFEQAFGWTRTQVTVTASISLVIFALTTIPAGMLQDIRGPRFTALVSAGFLGIAFLAVSQIANILGIYAVHGLVTVVMIVLAILLVGIFEGDKPSRFGDAVKFGVLGGVSVVSLLVAQSAITGNGTDSLWMLYLTYGFLGGVGIGMGYVSPIAASVKWFPYHRGLITGVAVAGFGFGSLIFAPTARWTIEQVGLSNFFLIHGIVCAVVLTAGALLLKNPPADFVAPKPARMKTKAAAAKKSEVVWKEMVKTWTFWQHWLMFAFAATAGLMVITQLKPFATLKGLPPEHGAMAISILAIFNAGGRVLWGMLSDHLGRTKTMALMFALQAAMMVGANMLSGIALVLLAAAWIGFHFGGNFALFPSATADMFGTKNLGTNYSFVFTSYGVGGILGPMVAARVYDATGQYTAAFLFAGALCAAAAVLTFIQPKAATTRV